MPAPRRRGYTRSRRVTERSLDRLWAALFAAARPLSKAALAEAAGCSASYAKHVLAALRRAGWVDSPTWDLMETASGLGAARVPLYERTGAMPPQAPTLRLGSRGKLAFGALDAPESPAAPEIRISGKQRKNADRPAGIELMLRWPAHLEPPRGLAEGEERGASPREALAAQTLLVDELERCALAIVRVAVALEREQLRAARPVAAWLVVHLVGARWIDARRRASHLPPPVIAWPSGS